MKKLMFATALTASAVAFGTAASTTPFNAISFEGYSPSEPVTNVQEKIENYVAETDVVDTYFYYSTNSAAYGATDSSYVTNYTSYPSGLTRPTYFTTYEFAAGRGNNNYLALDTEGGTLWRSFDNSQAGAGLGAAQSVGDGIYIDTLVQFTLTEDEEPQVEDGDKLAIWVATNNLAGVTTTNLMVRAAVVSTTVNTPTTFVLNASVDPGTWYRLTVKAVADITAGGEEIPGFQIYLDGVLLTSDTITLDSGYLALLENDDNHADIAAGKYFASLSSATTLQGVGFQGTGAIDDLVLTTAAPTFGDTGIAFTLTGGENATVSYVIGSEASQNWDGSSTISVESGATITFTATPDTGYTYTGVTAEGWTLTEGNMVCETNSTEDITLAVPNAVALVTLTDPGIANATLTSPVLPAQYAPGATVQLTWTAAPGYTFPNGQTTLSRTITVGTDDLAAIAADVASSLSKVTFTVTVADIENVTVAATTNEAPVEAVVVNSLTNQYTVETNDTITVTVTPSKGYAYTENTMDFITGDWTLNGNGTISTNITVTEAVTLKVPEPDLRPYELDVSCDSSKTTVDTLVNGNPSFNGACIGDTIVITSDPEDGYEYASLPVGWEWDPENAGTIKTNITVDAAFIDTAEGNEASSDYFFGKYTITVPDPTPVSAPSGIEIVAGEQGSTTYATEEAAAAVTNSVTITVPAAVSNALETADVGTATYTSLFEPKVVSDGNGGYKIEIGLTAAAEAGLQTQVNTDAGTLAGTLTTDGSSASVTTTPGLYYAIKYGLSLDAMDYNTAGVLAEDTETSLPVPVRDQTAAFYKVIVSPKPITAVTPAQD